jgi:hypothetical protein
VLKITNGPQTFVFFILLQLPIVLYRGKSTSAGALSTGAGAEDAARPSATRKIKPARRVAPLAALDFAVYVLLIAGLWYVLHLLRSDVSGMPHSRALKYALDGGSAFNCLLWVFSVRGRLKALGRLSWTLDYCFITLVPCLLLFALRYTRYSHALILFVILQIPAVFLRSETIPTRIFPVDADS